MKLSTSLNTAFTPSVIRLLVIISIAFGMVNAEICARSTEHICGMGKVNVCARRVVGGKPSGDEKTKCEGVLNLKQARPGGWYSKGTKFFEIQNCGACPTPSPTPTPTAAPTPFPTPAPTPSPTPFPTSSLAPSESVSPAFKPTYACGPSLQVVNTAEPIVDIATPSGIGGPEASVGYKVNVTLESYSIHMRFRMPQDREIGEDTLIQFQEHEGSRTLDANHDNQQDDAFVLYEPEVCLFDCERFDIRTNCWVDLKITRAIGGEMKFQINDGINEVKTSVYDDSAPPFAEACMGHACLGRQCSVLCLFQ